MAAPSDDDADSGLSLLDEHGRLFGLVNIVDLLVVLFVVAVVVAGVALVFGGSDGQPDTRYATIELGSQPGFLASEITPGDEFSPEGTSDNITVTDVYRFEEGGETQVIVRAQVAGTTLEPTEPDATPTFQFRGEPLRIGQQLTIQTTEYAVDGNTTQVARSGDRLPVSETPFVIETSVPAGTAAAVGVGDEYRTSGDTIAEIETLERLPGADDNEETLVLGVSARTIERQGTTEFAGQPVRVGSTVPFDGDGYNVSGELIQRGSTDLPTGDSEFVLQTSLPAEAVDAVAVGDEYRTSGDAIAEITALRQFPAGGTDERTLLVGVSARTIERQGTTEFAGQPVRVGSTVPFDGDGYELAGEIVQRGSSEIQTGTRTVTIELTNVRPPRAAAINEGLTATADGSRIAEISSKTTTPADVVLESEDGNIFLREHPRNLDVELDVELTVRELGDGSARFRGTPLRTGERIVVDFGTVRVRGSVTALSDG